MSKKRRTQISASDKRNERKQQDAYEENKEHSISKPKKNLRRKTQLTRESDLEILTQASQTSNSPSISVVYEECKENLERDQDISSAKVVKACSEWKELDYTKNVLPSSQGGKLVPTFTKSKKLLIKRQERNFEETTTIWTKEGQHMDQNVSCTAVNTVQNPITSAESSVTKMESARDHTIPHCEKINEKLDKCGIRKINNNDATSSDSQAGIGIEPNSQASSYEKETSQKQVSFFLCASSNDDAHDSEKRALPTEPLKCQLVKQMNVDMLPEGRIIDHIKSSQHEEVCLGSSDTNMQQNKSMPVILKADETDDPSWIKNGNRKDSSSPECMDNQAQRETSMTQLPVITDILITTSGKLNSSLCTASTGKQRNADAKETESIPDKSGKAEEQNDNCACSSIEISESGASCYKSILNKKATDQQNQETNGNPIEKGIRSIDAVENTPCRREAIFAEQNSIKNQSVSGTDFPYVQPVYPYLEKEVDHSEPTCVQIILKGSLISPQSDEGVLSGSRKISGEDIVCRMDSTEPNLTEPNVPTLLIQNQETICPEHLVSNMHQSEFNRNNLITGSIMEALSSRSVAEKTVVKVSKAETKTRENSFFSSDIYVADEASAQCERSNSKPDQVESSLFSVEIPPPQVLGGPSKEMNAQSKVQGSFVAHGTDSSISAPSGLDMVAQAYCLCPDSFSLDLESLPDTQLECISESHSLEFQSQKTRVLNDLQPCSKDISNQYATRNQGKNILPPPDSTKIHANNVRDEMEKICDPSKQEDATDVVYGLIKELSNLNRLIMSTHRDLDSLKRMKSRRNKHGKVLSHSMNNMTSMVCVVKKKREL